MKMGRGTWGRRRLNWGVWLRLHTFPVGRENRRSRPIVIPDKNKSRSRFAVLSAAAPAPVCCSCPCLLLLPLSAAPAPVCCSCPCLLLLPLSYYFAAKFASTARLLVRLTPFKLRRVTDFPSLLRNTLPLPSRPP